jgi:surface protein
MFLNCYNLKSIDISHFDTSKTKNMNGMFFQCNSLENLELGNLDTSSVTDMRQMFYNCYSLKSLNLNSFNTVNVQANRFNEMFFNFNVSIIKYCINDEISEEIKSQLSSFIEMNCSDLCFDNSQKKYIIEKNKCISECNNDITYIYEYDNICYASCPNGTHLIDNNLCETDLVCDNYYNYEQNDCLDEIPLGYYLNDTSKKTIDKCYIRCNNCTLDSMLNNLCISCNNSAGYFAKLNDTPNDIIFVNCFTEEEIGSGYYLDTIKNIYFPCYFTCKSCDGKGNSDNHQCSECYSNYTLINGNCYFIPNIETTIIVSSIIDSTMIAISTTEITKTTEITEIIETTEITKTTEITEIIETTEITKTTEITEIIETTGITETNTIEIINNLEGNSYSYDITNKQKEEHSNSTFIDFSEEFLDYLYKRFNLNKETEKIYVTIADNLPDDPRAVTSDYNYRFFLANGTELNLSNIDEDVYVDFYVPITDLEKANYNYSKYFLNQGYDIYDENSAFYNDFCTPAFNGDNDMTLKDRKKYLYPSNITLCKDNCKYNGVDTENDRIICSCNLNSNNEGNTTEEEDNSHEDNGNFLSYFLDNINYNVFKCYILLGDFSNLEKNFAFFTILGVFLVILVLNLIYYFYFLPTKQKEMLAQVPTKESVKKEIIKELKRFKIGSTNSLNNPLKKKKKWKFTKATIKKKKKRKKENKLYNELTKGKTYTKRVKKGRKLSINKKKNYFSTQSIRKFIIRKKNGENKINQDIMSNDDINDLPYTRAKKIDKRNIFKMFYSIIIQKLSLIDLIVGQHKIRIMVICEYILSFLFNFFFNAFLYSDEVVSQKYHNNGELDIFVTLVLSILSNIITSIICFYINYSKGLDERWDMISELKVKIHYIRNVILFFRYLRLKFIYFFICEIILISGCFYYIVIFCIVYSKSKGSLIVNYLTSLLEGFVVSVAISLIIVATRKIGLSCMNKRIYNISKYINNKY